MYFSVAGNVRGAFKHLMTDVGQFPFIKVGIKAKVGKRKKVSGLDIGGHVIIGIRRKF